MRIVLPAHFLLKISAATGGVCVIPSPHEQGGELSKPTGVDTFVPFAFIAAVGSVGFENIAVSCFQFFQDTGLVYNSGSAVIGECAEKNRVLAVIFIKRYEFCKIFSEKRIGLCLGKLNTTSVWLTRLNLMPVADIRPVLWVVHSLKFLDDENGTLKERQLHYRPFGGESRRSDRYGHYRQKNHKYFLHRLSGLVKQSGIYGTDNSTDSATYLRSSVVFTAVLSVELKCLLPRGRAKVVLNYHKKLMCIR